MKHVLKTVALAALVASSHAVLAETSPFPLAAETNVGQPALDTYADQMARSGKLIIGSGSPYPIAAEANVGQPPLDTFADHYARATRFADEPGAPSSGRADVEKWAIDPSSI